MPLFTSLAGTARLEATPTPAVHKSRARTHTARARVRSRAQRPATSTRSRAAIIVRRKVRAGRSAIVLSHLRPGTVYLLRLNIESTDGQTAASSAALRVARG